jgi:hypothetical protein
MKHPDGGWSGMSDPLLGIYYLVLAYRFLDWGAILANITYRRSEQNANAIPWAEETRNTAIATIRYINNQKLISVRS